MKLRVEVYFCHDDFTWTDCNFYLVDHEPSGHPLNDATVLKLVRPEVKITPEDKVVVVWGVYGWEVIDTEITGIDYERSH